MMYLLLLIGSYEPGAFFVSSCWTRRYHIIWYLYSVFWVSIVVPVGSRYSIGPYKTFVPKNKWRPSCHHLHNGFYNFNGLSSGKCGWLFSWRPDKETVGRYLIYASLLESYIIFVPFAVETGDHRVIVPKKAFETFPRGQSPPSGWWHKGEKMAIFCATNQTSCSMWNACSL